jgi:hypothetical protein
MLQNHVSQWCTGDRSRLVGVVTEGDFLRGRETGTVRKRPRWLDLFNP